MSTTNQSHTSRPNKPSSFTRLVIQYSGDKASQFNQLWEHDRFAFYNAITEDTKALLLIKPAHINIIWRRNNSCLLQWAYTGRRVAPYKDLFPKVKLIEESWQDRKEQLSIVSVHLSVGRQTVVTSPEAAFIQPSRSVFGMRPDVLPPNPTRVQSVHNQNADEVMGSDGGSTSDSRSSSPSPSDCGSMYSVEDEPRATVKNGEIDPYNANLEISRLKKEISRLNAEKNGNRWAIEGKPQDATPSSADKIMRLKHTTAYLKRTLEDKEHYWSQTSAANDARVHELLTERDFHQFHHRANATRVAELEALLERQAEISHAHGGITLEEALQRIEHHGQEMMNLRQARDTAKAEAVQAQQRETTKSKTDMARIATLEHKLQAVPELEAEYMASLDATQLAQQRLQAAKIRQTELEASAMCYTSRLARANLRCAILQWLNQRYQHRTTQLEDLLSNAATQAATQEATITAANEATVTLEATLSDREAAFADLEAIQASLNGVLNTSKADLQQMEQRALDAELKANKLREDLGTAIKLRDHSDAQALALEAQLEAAQAELAAAATAVPSLPVNHHMDVDLVQARTEADEHKSLAEELSKAWTKEVSRTRVEQQKRLQAEGSLRLVQREGQTPLLLPGLLEAARLVEQACRGAS